MQTLSRTIASASAAVALASCTLLTGVDDLSVEPPAAADGGPSDVATLPPVDSARPADTGDGDGGAISNPDASKIDGCSPTGCFVLPAGFALIAYGSKGATCPNGFGQPSDRVEGATVGTGGCSCGCQVQQSPTCPSNGAMTTTFATGGAGVCDLSGGTTSAGCSADGYLGAFAAGNEHKYIPPGGGPNGGTCTAASSKDASKLTFSTESRTCVANVIPQCNAAVCLPSLAAPFKACIAHDGDVACPPDFPDHHLLGTGATFTCGESCTCTVNGTCSGGHLNFYASADCTGGVAMTATANGTCQQTTSNPPGATYGSHKYFPNPPANVTCGAGGSSAASAPAMTAPTTICCQ